MPMVPIHTNWFNSTGMGKSTFWIWYEYPLKLKLSHPLNCHQWQLESIDLGRSQMAKSFSKKKQNPQNKHTKRNPVKPQKWRSLKMAYAVREHDRRPQTLFLCGQVLGPIFKSSIFGGFLFLPCCLWVPSFEYQLLSCSPGSFFRPLHSSNISGKTQGHLLILYIEGLDVGMNVRDPTIGGHGFT